METPLVDPRSEYLYRIKSSRPDLVYKEFTALVRKLTRKYGRGDPEYQEDFQGELNMRFYELLSLYNPDLGVPLQAFIVRMMTARAYTFLRSYKRYKGHMVLIYDDPRSAELLENCLSINNESRGLDHKVCKEMVPDLLPEMIHALPSRQAMVLVSRYIECRSFDDIASELDITPATVRSLLRHALNNVRQRLRARALID